MPLVIKQKSMAHDFKQEQEINKKWFKYFFDDLGAVEVQGKYARKKDNKIAEDHKLTK